MVERSELRLCPNPHIDKSRANEPIIEVWREGKKVATIYGTREGVQIVSQRFGKAGEKQRPVFFLSSPPDVPSWIVPMLEKAEECAWCGGTGVVAVGWEPKPCPICEGLRDEADAVRL